MLPGSRRRELATAAGRLADLPVLELPRGLRVHEARSWAARRDGLAGVPALPEHLGLWIAPCRSIHTIGMRFALDLVWLDRHDVVVGVAPAVLPRRQRTNWQARSVIEVASGRGQDFADAWTDRGDTRPRP